VRQSKSIDQVKTTNALLVGDEISGTQVPKSSPEATGGDLEFRMSAGGLQARAVELDGQMIILAGSDARVEEAPSLASNVRAYREQLRMAGKLRPAEGSNNLRFTEDIAFASPSAAAAAVMGTSRNGRVDWINVATNETYAEWQDRLVSAAEQIPTGAPSGDPHDPSSEVNPT
jgi:hypothetical protein